MIEETGIVTSIEGITAKVAVQRKGACEGCAVKGICETTEGGTEIEALNPVNAKVGQTVKVSMKPQAYLKGTILVYGIPLIFFITGAIIGKNIGEQYFKETNSDLVAAIAGFSALVISFLGVKIWSRNVETNPEYKPVIEEIISKRGYAHHDT
ncbi:MAG: SoxR reducing system RseC family protein [Nitrospirae bacterium]|nr:SoxR reducing system RseC family protein [Nitrospirota bacterium]